MYVDLATPESLIWGICDDKKVFSDTNETVELDRVNYTPVAWTTHIKWKFHEREHQRWDTSIL